MSSFSAEWLASREPADAAARSATITDAIVARFARRSLARVLDLGAGTGANARYLAPHLPARQAWLLVDYDEALLSAVPDRLRAWAARAGWTAHVDGPRAVTVAGAGREHLFETRAANLASLDDPRLFEARDLVTASALLDLVSDAWLGSLVARCREASADVLFALSYDGRLHCTPEDSGDAEIRRLVNAHQRRDKGFGPALGPNAASRAADALAAAGYTVHAGQSDWVLTPDTAALQAALIEGWARAAAECAPGDADAIRRWEARRLIHAARGVSTLVVGHVDLAAWLPDGGDRYTPSS